MFVYSEGFGFCANSHVEYLVGLLQRVISAALMSVLCCVVAQALTWSYTTQENVQLKESNLFVLRHSSNVSCVWTKASVLQCVENVAAWCCRLLNLDEANDLSSNNVKVITVSVFKIKLPNFKCDTMLLLSYIRKHFPNVGLKCLIESVQCPQLKHTL